MKKLVVVSVMLIGITAFFVGCSSVPEHVNLTGAWNFTYGPNLQKQGVMTLNQDGNSISGEGSNVEGKFAITGKLDGGQFTFTGKGENSEFTSNCTLSSSSQFQGTFNSTSGASGQINGTRQ